MTITETVHCNAGCSAQAPVPITPQAGRKRLLPEHWTAQKGLIGVLHFCPEHREAGERYAAASKKPPRPPAKYRQITLDAAARRRASGESWASIAESLGYRRSEGSLVKQHVMAWFRSWCRGATKDHPFYWRNWPRGASAEQMLAAFGGAPRPEGKPLEWLAEPFTDAALATLELRELERQGYYTAGLQSAPDFAIWTMALPNGDTATVEVLGRANVDAVLAARVADQEHLQGRKEKSGG